MEASVGQHRHVALGLGLGFLAGTIGGIWLGAAGQHGEARSLNELGGAIGGAFFGTIIGGTAGYFWRSDKWMPVYLPQHRISLNRSSKLRKAVEAQGPSPSIR
jgi:hypothetical protein